MSDQATGAEFEASRASTLITFQCATNVRKTFKSPLLPSSLHQSLSSWVEKHISIGGVSGGGGGGGGGMREDVMCGGWWSTNGDAPEGESADGRKNKHHH